MTAMGKSVYLEVRVQIIEIANMIYVLAYPQFEARVSQSLTAFRRIHEPERAQLVAPHITLVFGVTTVSSEQITALCQQTAKETSPILTEFSTYKVSYDPFEKTHKIALLCDRGADFLTALHQKLYKGAHNSEFDPTIPYRAHMAIGANDDLLQLEDADIASIGDFPITAKIDGLSVVQMNGGNLRTIGSFKFSM